MTCRRRRCVFLLMKLPAERVRMLKEYGWQRKATITAVLLAAFYRALRTLGRPVNEDAVEIGTAVDLRRFLPPGTTVESRRETSPRPSACRSTATAIRLSPIWSAT